MYFYSPFFARQKVEFTKRSTTNMNSDDPYQFDESDESSSSPPQSSSEDSVVDESTGLPRKLGTLAIPLSHIVDSIRKLNYSINIFTVEQYTDLNALKIQLQGYALQSKTNCASAIAVTDLLIDHLKVFLTIDDMLEKILKQIPNLDDQISDIIRYIHPPTFELFLKKHEDLLTKLRSTETSVTEMCAICGERAANIALVRNCSTCAQSNTPPCRCATRCCLNCLLETFYTQSEHQVRTYGTCPTCRSHFCLDDLTLFGEVGAIDEANEKKRQLPDDANSPKRIKL